MCSRAIAMALQMSGAQRGQRWRIATAWRWIPQAKDPPTLQSLMDMGAPPSQSACLASLRLLQYPFLTSCLSLPFPSAPRLSPKAVTQGPLAARALPQQLPCAGQTSWALGCRLLAKELWAEYKKQLKGTGLATVFSLAPSWRSRVAMYAFPEKPSDR